MTRNDFREDAWSFGVGAATVYHAAADWGMKLLFALAVAVLAPRVGRLLDLVIQRLFTKDKP